MSDPIPVWQVLKEEYASLHESSFPNEYLTWSFFKDHFKDHFSFALKLNGQSDDFLKALKARLSPEAWKDLEKYATEALSEIENSGSADPPPDDLQGAIVDELNFLLKTDISHYFEQEQNANALSRLGEILRPESSSDSPKPDELPFLNRVLLELAYPHEIYKVNDTLSGIYAHLHQKKHSALCISGGGIRSATFALGIIQGLARCKLLDKFDYMSTVSGGGYIGSWLTGWIHRHLNGEQGVVEALQERPTPNLNPEPLPLSHLRDYSNYLSPRLGILSADTWTLIAIYIRNLILNWLVLLPLIAAVLMVPRLYAVAVNHIKNNLQSHRLEQHPNLLVIFLVAGVVLGALAIAYIGINRPSSSKRNNSQGRFIACCLVPLLAASILLTIYWAWYRSSGKPDISLPYFILFGFFINLLGFVISSLMRLSKVGLNTLYELLAVTATGVIGGCLIWLLSRSSFLFMPEDSVYDIKRRTYICFAVPLLLSVFVLTAMLFEGIISFFTTDEDREWWSRSDAWNLIAIVGWAAVGSVVVMGPVGLGELEAYVASIGGLSGLITILLGRSSSTPATRKEQEKGGWQKLVADHALKLAAPVFALFLLILLVLAATVLIKLFSGSGISNRLSAALGINLSLPSVVDPIKYDHYDHLKVVYYSPFWLVIVVMAFLALVSCGMALVVNINRFSLHAMYRNRLIRAYLGASNTHRKPNQFTGFDPNDNIRMHKLWPTNEAGKQRRKLMHVINMALNLVGGDKLAWQQRKAESFTVSPLHSGSYCVGYRRSNEYGGDDGISLGTAVAISGAAASPNMGYHSSAVITFLMMLFNSRLGWWLGNPGKAGDATYNLEGPWFALKPLIAESLGLTNDQSSYVYLSDGGHFENLALYEMVLRRSHFIVVSDGSQDEDDTFESLGNAARKIRIDMGVPIDFSEEICIYSRAQKKKSKNGRYCAIGRIRYSCVDGPGTDGILIYIKPAFYGDEPRDIYEYARANPAFPHETTADQFFTESQFESYRMLGSHIMQLICEEGYLPDELNDLLRKSVSYLYPEPPIPKWLDDWLKSLR
ncbi:MAG: hypothetical protein DMF60_18765 [Acidobacteria bacterium]|nr:MAG: hypothetical protein DMF60_18765 [Acidobacteriota bacterium]